MKKLFKIFIVSLMALNMVCFDHKEVKATNYTLNQIRNTYPEGTSWTSANQYDNCSGCAAFAAKVFNLYYGVSFRTASVTYDINNIKAGDILKYYDASDPYQDSTNGHTVWVLSRNTNSITIAEGNYNNRIVHWDRTISFSKISKVLRIYQAPYQLETSTTSIPNAVTNLRSDKKIYNTKEYIKFNWDPSYGTENYWVYLWKNGVQLYSLDCGKNTSFTSAPISSGKYTLVIRPGNKNGFNEKSKSYSFVVTNNVPDPVTNLRSEKKIYSTKEYIRFDWDPSYGTENYWVYLWKNGVQLYSLNCGGNTSFTSAPTSPGKYTLIIRPGNINGFNEKSQNYSFVVEDENNLREETYTVLAEDYNGVYDGKAHTIALNGIKEQSTINYSVDNINWTTKKPTRTNAGTTTVYYQITNPNYKTIIGSREIIIQKRNVSQLTYSKIANQTYTGKQIKPSIVVKDGNKTLQKDVDYTVSYGTNKASGKGTIKITGKGNYTGTITKTFTIAKRNVSTLTYSKISNKSYTGKQIKPSITVKYNGKTLTKGTSYTVSYGTNKATGKATIKITGKGNYTGSIVKTFYIVPKAPTGLKVSVGRKNATVKYSKSTGVSGYQISYRVKGITTWKNISLTGLSKKITKLTSKKTYEFKVRAYKTINGKKYYGSYSTIKTIKVK